MTDVLRCTICDRDENEGTIPLFGFGAGVLPGQRQAFTICDDCFVFETLGQGRLSRQAHPITRPTRRPVFAGMPVPGAERPATGPPRPAMRPSGLVAPSAEV